MMGTERLRPAGTACRYEHRGSQDPNVEGDPVPNIKPEQYPVVWQTQAFLFVDGNCNGVYDAASDSALAADRMIEVSRGVIADTCAISDLRGKTVIGRRDCVSPAGEGVAAPSHYDYRLVETDTGLSRPYAKPLDAVVVAGGHGCPQDMIYQPYDDGTMDVAGMRTLYAGETRGVPTDPWDPRLEPYILWLDRMGELTTRVTRVTGQAKMSVSQ